MKLQNIDTFHHFGLVGMKAMLRSRDSKSSYLLGFLLYLQGCIQRLFSRKINRQCFFDFINSSMARTFSLHSTVKHYVDNTQKPNKN